MTNDAPRVGNRSARSTRRWFMQGALSSGLGLLGLPSAVAARRSLATERAKPINLERDGTFDGVIDLYWENDAVNLAQAKRLGVKAVIYRTSLGLYDRPRERAAYRDAKTKALDLGLLWGAFHVPGKENPETQLKAFYDIENGTDGRTLMVLDWENNSKGVPDRGQMRKLVEQFRTDRGYYPMIYGGNILAEACGQHRDDVLAKCPLWFIDVTNYNKPAPQIPSATWSDYTLWQYATEHRSHRDPYPKDVLPGADWSRFKGTAEDLSSQWPFRVV